MSPENYFEPIAWSIMFSAVLSAPGGLINYVMLHFFRAKDITFVHAMLFALCGYLAAFFVALMPLFFSYNGDLSYWWIVVPLLAGIFAQYIALRRFNAEAIEDIPAYKYIISFAAALVVPPLVIALLVYLSPGRQ